MEHYLKPLRSMTNYKVSELEDIALKLSIFDITRKYKKNEL